MAVGTGYSVTNQWQNADGLTIAFTSAAWPKVAARANTEEAVKYAVIDVDLTKLGAGITSYTTDLTNDGVTDGFNEGDFYFPIGSSVLRVVALATEAAVGGTSFTVGTYLIDGTIVSATNLVTATEGVLANIATKGARVYGAGAYTSTTAGTAGPGATSAAREFVGVTTAGTFTAGKLRIFIEYLAGATEV